MESTSYVKKKLKQGCSNTKSKQGKSDIWTTFSIITDKMETNWTLLVVQNHIEIKKWTTVKGRRD